MPLNPALYAQLNQALQDQQAGEHATAEKQYRTILQANPNQPDALHLLGMALFAQGQLEGAHHLLLRALHLRPQWPEALSNWALVQEARGDLPAAATALDRALELAPRQAQIWSNRALIAHRMGAYHAAIALAQHAATLAPTWADPHYVIGRSYREILAHDQALDAYTLAVSRDPDRLRHSNLLYNLLLHPHLQDSERFAAFCKWGKYWPSVVRPQPKKGRQRIHIGYLSGDFGRHAAAHNFLPLFEQYDRERFCIFAYHQGLRQDDWTQRFITHTEGWRSIRGQSDVAVGTQIQADQIDILVDLSGHTQDHRLGVMALRPAPLQISAFGWVFTTGLSTIDWQFSDAWATPPERTAHFSEQLWHLPSQIHWQPDPAAQKVAVTRPPGQPLTLGCPHPPRKLNRPLIALWSKILAALPEACLSFKGGGYHTESAAALKAAFGSLGIAPERLDFHGATAHVEHLQWFQHIDLVLDSFPYTGGMTTCDALWMGVPVLAYDGDGVRTSISLLHAVQAPELVVNSPEAYVQTAIALGRMPERLAAYRANLRQRFQASAVMDGPSFVTAVEQAYLTMFSRLPKTGE